MPNRNAAAAPRRSATPALSAREPPRCAEASPGTAASEALKTNSAAAADGQFRSVGQGASGGYDQCAGVNHRAAAIGVFLAAEQHFAAAGDGQPAAAAKDTREPGIDGRRPLPAVTKTVCIPLPRFIGFWKSIVASAVDVPRASVPSSGRKSPLPQVNVPELPQVHRAVGPHG